MKIEIKRLTDNAVIPAYAKSGDAGLDITATSKSFDGVNVVYGTGIAIKIPEGYVGLLFPRSSISKKDMLLTNSVGVIDSGFTGEILFKFKPANDRSIISRNAITNVFEEIIIIEEYEVGDRIGQLLVIPYPQVEFKEVDELPTTERGTGGYGSTGN